MALASVDTGIWIPTLPVLQRKGAQDLSRGTVKSCLCLCLSMGFHLSGIPVKTAGEGWEAQVCGLSYVLSPWGLVSSPVRRALLLNTTTLQVLSSGMLGPDPPNTWALQPSASLCPLATSVTPNGGLSTWEGLCTITHKTSPMASRLSPTLRETPKPPTTGCTPLPGPFFPRAAFWPQPL